MATPASVKKTQSAYTAFVTDESGGVETSLYTVSWSNLGPLTTTFTPPTSCNTPLPTNVFVDRGGGPGGQHAQVCGWTRTLDLPRTDCYPSYIPPNPSESPIDDNNWLPGEQKIYYSPGYQCPSGWDAATTMTEPAPTSIGFWDGFLGLQDVFGTQVVCCPSAWTAGGLVQCYSPIPTTTRISLCVFQSVDFNFTHRPTTASSGRPISLAVYTTPAVLLVHDSAHDESAHDDLPGDEASEQEQGDSSTTAIAVGVAVPVAVLLIVLIVVLCWLRRRKRRKASQSHQPGNFIETSAALTRHGQQSQGPGEKAPSIAYMKPELDSSDPNREPLPRSKPELDGSSPAALPTEPQEMEDSSRREMEDSSRRAFTSRNADVPRTLRAGHDGSAR